MANSITFAGQTSPQMSLLDTMFRQVGVSAPVPCTVSGANAITMTPASYALTFSAYANYMQFSGIVAAPNILAVTIQVQGLAALPGYKDSPSGPVALQGGELVAGCAFTARYDSALNAGNGGFHVLTTTAFSGGTISGAGAIISLFGSVASIGGVTLTSMLLTGTSLSVVAKAVQVGSSLSTLTRINSALATLTYTITSANAVQDQNMAMSGALVNDVVSLGMGSSAPAGAGFTGFCGTVGTITVRLVNPSTVTLGAATLTVRAMAQGTTP